jgi:hypothetical protein
MSCVKRQIVLCLTFVLILPFCTGCGKKPKGNPAAVSGPTSPESDKHADMSNRVENWKQRIGNGPDGDPGKRKSAVIAAGRAASNPGMTAEMKLQLVESLKKMVAAEPMSEADDETKQQIIEEGNKAIQALGG